MRTLGSDQLRALAASATALAGELSLEKVLETIVERAAQATGAPYAALGVLGDDQTISQFVNRGLEPATVTAIGHLPQGKGLLGLLIRDPRIVRTDDIASHPASYGFPPNHPPMGSFLGAPVRSGGQIFGNLYLCDKPDGFTEEDEEIVAVLAAQAGAAIENAQLSAKLQRMAIADERDRISRDLHDGAIQSLFSIGMGLESARSMVHTDPARVDERLDQAVDALDSVIQELRNYIFQLKPHQAASLGLIGGIAELAREHEVNALVRPDLDVQPDLDVAVSDVVVPDILQIIREALSNCAKHAAASTVRVRASLAEGVLTVEVADDGTGFSTDGTHVGRGLENIAERARALAAELTIDSAPGHGTRLTLQLPFGGHE